MDSPRRWPSGVLEQDVLPSTSAFVAPGQEDYFLLQGQGLESFPGQRRSGSVPPSPSQVGQLQPGLLSHGVHPGFASQAHNQDPSLLTAASPANRGQPSSHLYDMPPLHHHQPAHLAGLDFAAASLSPGRGMLQTSPSRMFPSPTALNQGMEHGLLMYGGQNPYLGFDAASQLGLQHQRLHSLAQQNSAQALGTRLSIVAAAAAGAGLMGDSTAGYGLAPPGRFPSYFQQQQSGSPLNQQQALLLRASAAEQCGSFASPSRAPPRQSPPHGSIAQQAAFTQPSDSLVGGPVADAHVLPPPPNEAPRAGTAREGGTIWVGPDAVVHTAAPPQPASPAAVAVGRAGPSANHLGSPQSPSPADFPAVAAAGGGGLHGGVRHVVEELRTSPLLVGSDFETPVRGSGRALGGGAQGGGGSGEKNAAVQRYQAQIVALERQNAELHKRLSDTQAALDASLQARQALEAKQDAMADQVHQANLSSKARESSLENARRANDALAGELRSCQEELGAARNALAAAKDTAVQWQDRALEVGKELEAARKKIETLGEEERRLSSENMALRKDLQQLNDAIIKGRIESAELREKLRTSQQETARAAGTAQALASQRENEQENAAVQLALMRNKVIELESRNSQLMYDLASLREDATRARQAADAAKAALAAKPAGIASDGGGSARHPQGLITAAMGWTAHEPQSSGAGGTGGAYGGYSGGGYGTGSYGGGGAGAGAGPYSNGGGAGAGYGGSSYGGPSNGGSGSNGGGSAYGSGGGASGRPPLPPPPAAAPATGAFLPSHQDQATAAAILRDLPPDVAFSKLDPETFRSMVRAEAEALARGGAGAGGGGHGGGANSPLKPPSYGTRYGGDLTADPSGGALSGAAALPRVAWGEAAGRDQMAAAAAALPPPDVRGMWLPPPQPAELRTFGISGPSTNPASRAEGRPGGGGGGSGGSPPPYAVNVGDNPYAYRRPANAVGTGVAGQGGGGGGGATHSGDTPYGTEDTVKDMIARSKALEDQLMVLCAEKGGLEAEYARMPLGAGRSLRERNRKQVVEQRLDLLNKEISSVRMQLKRLGVK